ncbi:MAG: LpxI family protein [Myxococcaceae bacterium]
MQVLGLIAGSGKLPHLVARGAKAAGRRVVAVAHKGETDPALADVVDALAWIHVGQVGRLARQLRDMGASEAAMAGGISRVKSFRSARLDWGAWGVLRHVRSFRDDGMLRAIAAYLDAEGVRVVAPTQFLQDCTVPEGLLAGARLSEDEEKDVRLGFDVAVRLGEVDVGQTVVVRHGLVLALEAIEGTDAAILRAGALAGPGAVVVKRCKPAQDERFDLPAIGLGTLAAMRSASARVLAVHAGKTLLLDGAAFIEEANRLGITVVGWSVP